MEKYTDNNMSLKNDDSKICPQDGREKVGTKIFWGFLQLNITTEIETVWKPYTLMYTFILYLCNAELIKPYLKYNFIYAINKIFHIK